MPGDSVSRQVNACQGLLQFAAVFAKSGDAIAGYHSMPRNLLPLGSAHVQLAANQRFIRSADGAASATSVHLGAVACATDEQAIADFF
jgi:hypothetical protein